MNLDTFLQIKRRELYDLTYNESMSTATVFDEQFVQKCWDLKPQWSSEFPPEKYYQLSNGENFATDDELFLSLELAIKATLEESAKYPEHFYVIWCHESMMLPYPVVVIYDKKVFTENAYNN